MSKSFRVYLKVCISFGSNLFLKINCQVKKWAAQRLEGWLKNNNTEKNMMALK